ncbi:MAG: GTP-binding protein [Acidibrevibacterium sp.]|uniref:GTP-binding protein n=1 Tax=Acidibrevibacterium fodinaquatile TaxID=1969806 RepID=UPI0023A7F02D|nr:GTP-binding protein [Acidibrevibacterium fodinaquatile]MCA7120595.1 GTP-binding protein [Acidibrevibacterium fodinaquatile]
MAKEILCGFGVDVDAVAGWLGSYGGEDSPDDISRGLFAGEVGSGERVLRVKGIIAVGGEAAPVAIHGVQYLVHPPIHMRTWPDADHRSRIVFIVQGLDPAAIKRSLLAFLGHQLALI